ncbi:hypothetical protein Hanom_Chr16g01450071 [Helianthus anomalus]
MASIVLMLNSISMTLPAPSKPAYFMHNDVESEMPLAQEYNCLTRGGSLGTSKCSVNEVTISDFVPR